MDDRKLRKLQAILALAADQAGTPEGEEAMTRAKALAEKYGLSMDAARKGGTGNDGAEVVAIKYKSMWEVTLAQYAIQYFDGQICCSSQTKTIYVVLQKKDRTVFDALLEAAKTEIWDRSLTVDGGKAERTTWRSGAATGFGAMLREWDKRARLSLNGTVSTAALEEAAHADGRTSGPLLPVLAGRQMENAQVFSKSFPRLGKAKARSVGNGSNSAYMAGYDYGRNMKPNL